MPGPRQATGLGVRERISVSIGTAAVMRGRFAEQLPVALLDLAGNLDPVPVLEVLAPCLLVIPDHGLRARPRDGPLFRRRLGLAGLHQHVPEVIHCGRNQVKESIGISFAQGQDGAMDVISLYIVIPADDLQDVWKLLRPEHRASNPFRVRRNAHAADLRAMSAPSPAVQRVGLPGRTTRPSRDLAVNRSDPRGHRPETPSDAR